MGVTLYDMSKQEETDKITAIISVGFTVNVVDLGDHKTPTSFASSNFAPLVCG